MKRILGSLAAITIGLSTLGIATTPADAGGTVRPAANVTYTAKKIGKVTKMTNIFTLVGRQRSIFYKSDKHPTGNSQSVNKSGYDSCAVGKNFYAVKVTDTGTGVSITFHNCTGGKP